MLNNMVIHQTGLGMRTLGKTGISVSKISFGTVCLGLPYGIGVCQESDMPTEAESILLLHQALDRGLNFYDTALSYGKSERIIGKAFSGCRDKVVICTKPGHLYDPYKGQPLPPDTDIRLKLQTSLERNLSSLQTDYIDVYMSHDGTEEVMDNETVVDFYQQLKAKGIIRATGISVYTPQQSLKAIQSGHWDVIQLAFNLMDQTQLGAIELAAQKGVGIVVRSVLFKGILTDRGNALHPALKSVQDHRQKYLSLLSNGSETLPELATRFVLSCKGVSSVLVGIDKPEYLEQALSVAESGQLAPDLLRQAKQLAYPDPAFLNLPQWDRLGWLK